MDVNPDRMLGAPDEFRALFESAPDLMYTHDLAGALTLVNRAFERVTGYDRQEAIGSNFFDLVAPSDRETVREHVFAQLGGESTPPFPLTLITRNNRAVQLEVCVELVFRDGRPAGVQGFARDVSQVATFTRYLELLHRLSTTNHAQIDTLLGDYLASGSEIFGVDHGAITSVSGETMKPFGSGGSDSHAAEVARAKQTLSLSAAGFFYIGTPIVINDSVFGVIGFWSGDRLQPAHPHPQAREVIEMMAKSIAAAIHQRELTDQLAHQANHDALTRLPNRLMLQRELDKALKRASIRDEPLAVVFIDLDRFKQINDTLGHEAGDKVLEQIAQRLQERIHPGDTLARMGGDEFTAILTGIRSAESAAEYARELLVAIRTPCRAAGRELFVTASVGISLYPRDGIDAGTLLRNADSAMYSAKNRTKNDFRFFTIEANAGARRRLELETHLRRALERGEFEMHYQPQVDLQGKLASLEALLVWDSPDLGRVAPSDFIPIAEDTGMILPIGAWVLQEACRQMAAWQAGGLSVVPIAVNVSVLQFAQPGFVGVVAQALSGANAPAGALELELTESLIMRDAGGSAALMRELRALGVKIAIDDFGTGYSSLSYLRQLPADSVKIDQSFLREAESGPATPALLKAIAALAHNIGLTVTAEGVETAAQLAIVREAGCDRAQGHMFGAALPRRNAEELLRDPGRLARLMGLP